MSLVWDTESITVNSSPDIAVQQNVAEVQIGETLSVQIDIPGPQGPPGVKNVYIQANNPATQYGWGEEETNYVWIPTP